MPHQLPDPVGVAQRIGKRPQSRLHGHVSRQLERAVVRDWIIERQIYELEAALNRPADFFQLAVRNLERRLWLLMSAGFTGGQKIRCSLGRQRVLVAATGIGINRHCARNLLFQLLHGKAWM